MSEAETSPSPTDGADGLSFEDAFEQLEAVVEEMEDGQVPLAELIEKYEAGIRLQRVCQQRLEEARGRIEIIRKRASGQVEIEPFDSAKASASEADTTNSESNPAKAAKPSLKEDGELF